MKVRVQLESWTLRAPFRIRGSEITVCQTLLVQIEADGCIGRGEATGVSYRGETAAGMLAVAREFANEMPADLDPPELQTMLPPGGVRNAFDCALWELDARRRGTAVWRLAGLPAIRPLLTTYTIGADSPPEMARQAIAHRDAPALKLKLTGDVELDAERIRQVRTARPSAWLGVDANQGYTKDNFTRVMPALLQAEVAQVEQPFAIGCEGDMAGIKAPFDLVADESVQVLADIERFAGLFDTVNIKLDKAGGLTHALAMARRAREVQMKVMVGNMIGTSWSQAPAFVVGQLCDVVDLDGPLFLQQDRIPGATYRDGTIWCGDDLWGASDDGHGVSQ